MACLLLRGGAGGFSSVVPVSAIEFEDGDEPCGLMGSRALPWRGLPPGGFILPRRVTRETAPREALRLLSAEFAYTRREVLARRVAQARADAPTRPKDSGDARDFLSPATGEPPDGTTLHVYRETALARQLAALSSPEERLFAALDHGSLQGFRAALASGADPDARRHPGALPVLFELAGHGWPEWIEVLLATEGLNPDARDAHGRSASFQPGVLARTFHDCGDGGLMSAPWGQAFRLLLRAELLRRYDVETGELDLFA